MKTQFVTNEKDKSVAALIPIKEYEELMEDLHDLKLIAQRRNEDTVPWEEVKKNLIADGLLQN